VTNFITPRLSRIHTHNVSIGIQNIIQSSQSKDEQKIIIIGDMIHDIFIMRINKTHSIPNKNPKHAKIGY
jgi:hypothetical protein